MHAMLLSTRRFTALAFLGVAFALAGCVQEPDGQSPGGRAGKTNPDPAAVNTTDGCPACCAAPNKASVVRASQAKAADGSAAVTAAGNSPENNAEVKLKVVKYSQLEAAIKAQRGKVVVLDLWGDFCLPCKKEFPHLVKLHERYARDGLVCMSLSVDEPDQKDAALAFLKAQKATFANYLLDEKAEAWQEIFDLKGVPAVFVYGRDGKRLRKFDCDDPDNQFTYADVEKLIAEVMKPAP